MHAVFSNAFVLLLRLWKFNHPPLEYCIMGDGAPVSSQLTPHYLLLLRNSYVLAQKPPLPSATDTRPIFVDSFPKLKIWYMQHQACLASALSGLVSGTPVHRNVDSLLGMMFWKLSRGGCNQSVSGSLSNSNSAPGIEESSSSSSRPRLPAWDIMEAVPFVVDAALTACSHSQLSPRELATGLIDHCQRFFSGFLFSKNFDFCRSEGFGGLSPCIAGRDRELLFRGGDTWSVGPSIHEWH